MGFEKIASDTGECGVYINPKTERLGAFKGWEIFRRNFGYIGNWLNISKLFSRTSAFFFPSSARLKGMFKSICKNIKRDRKQQRNRI